MKNIIGLVASYAFVALIILLAKPFEKLGKEASRKFIHIMLANWWLIAMYFFENAIWASIAPITFIIINYLSYKKDLIRVMERENQDGLGTVYYAISLLLIAIYTFGIINRPEIGLCASLIMGYSDGIASIVGKTIKSYEYKIGNTTKTLAGSLAMFIMTFIILVFFLSKSGTDLFILKSLILSAILTIVEAISIKGTDNLTLPVIATLLISIL